MKKRLHTIILLLLCSYILFYSKPISVYADTYIINDSNATCLYMPQCLSWACEGITSSYEGVFNPQLHYTEITDIKFTNTPLNRNNAVDLSSSLIGGGCKPLWCRKNGNILELYTEASKIYLIDLTDIGKTFPNLTDMSFLRDSRINTSKLEKITGLFRECDVFTNDMFRSFKLSTWNLNKVTSLDDLFYNCKNFTDLSMIENWNTSNCTSFSYTFYKCEGIQSFDKIKNWNISKGTTFSGMFGYCTNVESFDFLYSLDFSHSTAFDYTFCGCSNIPHTFIENLNLSNVITIKKMFYNSTFDNTTLDLSNWDCRQLLSMCGTFQNTNIESINLDGLNFSNVTDFSYLFMDCTNLHTVEIHDWTNKANYFERMFNNCDKLINIDVTNLVIGDTTKTIYTSEIFKNCSSITSLDLITWNSKQSIKWNSIFSNNTNLVALRFPENLELSTSVIYPNTFYAIQAILEEGITTENIDKYTYTKGKSIYTKSPKKGCWLYTEDYYFTIKYLNYNGTNLIDTNTISTKIYPIKDKDTPYKYATTTHDFSPIYFLGWSTIQNSSTVQYYNNDKLFNVTNLFGLNTSSMDDDIYTLYAVKGDNIVSFLYEGYKFNRQIKSLAGLADNGYTKNISDASNASDYKDLTITNIKWVDESFTSETNIAKQGEPIYARLNGTEVELYTKATTVYFNEDSSFMFCCFLRLQKLDILNSKINTSNITSFEGMFSNRFQYYATVSFSDGSSTTRLFDSRFTMSDAVPYLQLNLNKFDTSNATTMKNMFSDCVCDTLDVSSFNTNKVTDFSYMFAYNTRLINIIGISNFTGNPSTISNMFYEANVIKNIDLNNLNVSNCTSFNYIFYNCKKLEILKINRWNTTNCTSIYDMFYSCDSLKSLDISHFNVTKCTNFSQCFYNCHSISKLKLFDTSTIDGTKYSIDLPYMTKYLDDNEDDIADNNEIYTKALLDGKHTYIQISELIMTIYIHTNDIYDENGYAIDDSNIYTIKQYKQYQGSKSGDFIYDTTINDLENIIDEYNTNNISRFLYDEVIGYSSFIQKNTYENYNINTYPYFNNSKDKVIYSIRNLLADKPTFTLGNNLTNYGIGYIPYIEPSNRSTDLPSTQSSFNSKIQENHTTNELHLYMIHKRSNIDVNHNSRIDINNTTAVIYNGKLLYSNPDTDISKNNLITLYSR